jgi:hypothetical protein
LTVEALAKSIGEDGLVAAKLKAKTECGVSRDPGVAADWRDCHERRLTTEVTESTEKI